MIRPTFVNILVARPWLVGALAGAALAGGSAFAARAQSQDSTPLKASQAPSPAAQAKSEASKGDDVKALVEKLGSADSGERDRAIEKLRALGDKAVPALEEAAGNANNPGSKDTEIRWNARRVLREIRQDAAEGKEKRRPAQKGAETWPLPLDQDLQTLNLRQLAPLQADDLQKKIQELMQQQRDAIDQWKRSSGVDTVVTPQGRTVLRMRSSSSTSATDGSSSTEVRIENGKVQVTVKSIGQDGKESVQTYEANSMEEFKEKYPEIAKQTMGDVKILSLGGKLGTGGWIRSEARSEDHDSDSNEDSDMDSSEDHDESHDSQSHGMTIPLLSIPRGGQLPMFGGRHNVVPEDVSRIIGPDNGERLGVTVRAASPDLAAFFGLSSGSGFLVDTVEPKTQADALGLKPNDLVISINGKVIGKDSTLRQALAAVPAGKTLRVEVVRGLEGKKVLEGEKLAAEPSSSPAKENAPPKRAQR